jgi:hypothetical protein
MVNKRISWAAKTQQFGQEKQSTDIGIVNARGFSLCHLKSIDWGTGWRVLVRHREGEEEDKGRLT